MTPLGSNGAVAFTLVQGTTDEAVANNLVVQQMGGFWVRPREGPGVLQVTITCTSQQAASCEQTFSKS